MSGINKLFFALLSLTAFVFGYPFSFLPSKIDNSFEIKDCNSCFAEKADEKTVVFGINSRVSCFNYFGVRYSCDSFVRGSFVYSNGFRKSNEDFFLEPGENKEFYSFIDGVLSKKKANTIVSLSFIALDNDCIDFTLNGFSVFNRKVPDKTVYLETDKVKIGVSMKWGGALSYLEDLDSSVELVSKDGEIHVDTNASKRYSSPSLNKHVNLINCFDEGRLVQQSYYCNRDYENGYYMGQKWAYNPVQGGNQFGERSKIVDINVTDTAVYVKSRPLDWAKSAENISDSYMEATYTIDDTVVEVDCRFMDFSSSFSRNVSQELPAFYCIEPLDNFVYYKGDKPWTYDDNLGVEKNLIFWPDAEYPNYTSNEYWAAFTGDFEDSFGIGVYVEDKTRFLTGIYARGETKTRNPAVEAPTSYIAVVDNVDFSSFEAIEYSFALATGSVNEIRSSFYRIHGIE